MKAAYIVKCLWNSCILIRSGIISFYKDYFYIAVIRHLFELIKNITVHYSEAIVKVTSAQKINDLIFLWYLSPGMPSMLGTKIICWFFRWYLNTGMPSILEIQTAFSLFFKQFLEERVINNLVSGVCYWCYGGGISRDEWGMIGPQTGASESLRVICGSGILRDIRRLTGKHVLTWKGLTLFSKHELWNLLKKGLF